MFFKEAGFIFWTPSKGFSTPLLKFLKDNEGAKREKESNTS
jgi:hypothetical protein